MAALVALAHDALTAAAEFAAATGEPETARRVLDALTLVGRLDGGGQSEAPWPVSGGTIRGQGAQHATMGAPVRGEGAW